MKIFSFPFFWYSNEEYILDNIYIEIEFLRPLHNNVNNICIISYLLFWISILFC